MADVTFFFDPVCPWTWRASRWLTAVADVRNLEIEWRPLSLLVVNDWHDEQHGAAGEATHRALRLVERLHQDGRQADIAVLYEAMGRLAHEDGLRIDDDLVERAIRTAGLGDEGAALDDESLDAGVQAATERAVEAAGPGVGSPVLVLPGARRGLHGPVLKTIPEKAEAVALWEAVEALAPIEGFYEIKRGRS